jgi:hypothetical protein
MSDDKKFIFTCELNGRLGNQMFMIANAYSQAIDHNCKFIAPKYSVNADVFEYLDNIYKNIDFSINDIDDLKNDESYVNVGTTFDYSKMEIPKNKNIIFNGYFQSEKFFLSNSLKIKKLFSPTYEFIQKYHDIFPFLKNNDTIAINVRRGDYRYYPNEHPIISKEYIFKSLEYIPNNKTSPIIVISDDIKWCKENINIDNSFFAENMTSWEMLWLMSLCKHFIISNSSFSWWGAFLGEKKNSMVLCPDIWFGPEINVNTSDIYKNNWIKIPTYFKNGGLYPK